MNESDKPLVLIVDDDLFMLDFIHDALCDSCRVITAEGGVAALKLAREAKPAMVITDIMMPEMNGYELCRQIKEDIDICDTPVLFLSALNRIEDRLQGFDVGGEDFVLKPINSKVLEAKVAHVLQLIVERQQLKSQAQYATTTAMLAMTSMSETGVVIEGMKRFNYCTNPPELAQALLGSLQLFDVDAVCELLLPGTALAINPRGPASALEISVLHHIATMDRITQFKSRMAISYPHVRIVIHNMPVHDPDRCGRLRDHLAMLVEAAEARLDAIKTAGISERRGVAIANTIQSLTTALENIDHMQRQSKAMSTTILSDVVTRVEHALAGLELTERQEALLLSIIRDGLEDIADLQRAEAHFQDQLSGAVHELKIAACTH